MRSGDVLTMLIDTHCHINMMIKSTFDSVLTSSEIQSAAHIIQKAEQAGVARIINVGTSLIESKNCLALAEHFTPVYATVGIHPNDCTSSWKEDFKEISKMFSHPSSKKIVGIGEIGIDKHYPDFNLARQQDAFRAQIELALTHNRAMVIHSRDAAQETLQILEEYQSDLSRVIFHCFSYGQDIAIEVQKRGFFFGIGGTITYPKNQSLRESVIKLPLTSIVLETDAPFLPPQSLRGTQNSPQNIKEIALFIAQLKSIPFETLADITTQNALTIFNIEQ